MVWTRSTRYRGDSQAEQTVQPTQLHALPVSILDHKLPVSPTPSQLASTLSVAVDRAFSDFLEIKSSEHWFQ